MKKYSVRLYFTSYTDHIVYANDEHEADLLAENMEYDEKQIMLNLKLENNSSILELNETNF